jgi:hypothetical protein
MTTRTASTRRKEDCQRQRQSKVDAEITLFSKFGGPLTKRISLTADGSIKSDGSACLMARGEARRCEIASVAQLAGLIEQLPANQAVALGALRTGLPDQVQVVTKAKLVNGVAQPDIIARTKDNIAYREGQPAFALLDFDTKGMPDGVASKLKRLGFWGALLSVLPTLKDVARVVRRSTSAGLSRSDTGEQLPGSDGVHVYLMVRDGADIERFLRAVHDRCWFAGLGWMTVGAAGQLLERSVVDRMVGASERLVFEGGPILVPPLQQDRKSRRPIAVDGDALDTVSACPPLSTVEISEVDELRARERQRLKTEAARARAAFIDRRAARMVEQTGVPMPVAKQIVSRQCDGILLPGVELAFDDDELKGCTVADVLADPARFEDATLADPLEGVEYGPCKAKVLIGSDGTPWINSFAHGSTTYQLKYDAASVRNAVDHAKREMVVTSFVDLSIAADLTKKEEKELCHYVADNSGTSRQAVAAKLKGARDKGRLRPAEPTYSAEATYSSADEARNRTRKIIQDFLETDVACPK